MSQEAERDRSGARYLGKDLEAMSCARNYSEWILDGFGDCLRGDVAEVGSGSGNLSGMLLSMPGIAHLHCYEPSTDMYQLLEERLRGESRAACINSSFRDDAERGPLFDAILYSNVLEHIEDDAEELSVVRRRLRPGGKLCVFVPAGHWLFSDFDRSIGHFRRYSRGELVARVEDAGFSVERCRYVDSLGVIPWYVAFVLMRKTLSSEGALLYDRCVVPWLRRLETVCPPPTGKNLLLVASAS